MFAVVVILGVAGLLLAASGDKRSRAFSLNVPNATPVAILTPGEQACQRPITAPAAFGGVRLFGASTGGDAALAVDIRPAHGGPPLARGQTGATPASSQLDVMLGREIRAGRRIELCAVNLGHARMVLLGAGPTDPSIKLRIGGVASNRNLAVVGLRSRPRSLLASLPTAFSRASLFRPGWVGAWTFWALAGLVAVAIVLVGVGVAAAGDATDGESGDAENPTPGEGSGGQPRASAAPTSRQ